MRRGLHQLVEAEFLYQRGLPPQATYLFKHALIQDAAYQSLLRSTRQQYHQRIAQVLEARFPEIVETQPELLAQHYTEAGLAAQAMPYWQRAGQRALQRSANLEAVSHSDGLGRCSSTLPETPERAQQELDLQLALGAALIATGAGRTRVEHAYARACELCRRSATRPSSSRCCRLVTRYYRAGRDQAARELARAVPRPGRPQDDPAAPRGGPSAAGLHRVLAGRVRRRPAPTAAEAWRSTTRSSTRPSRLRPGPRRGRADTSRPGPLGLGYPTRPSAQPGATPWRSELAHPFSLAHAPAVLRATVISSAVSRGSRRTRAERPWRSRRAGFAALALWCLLPRGLGRCAQQGHGREAWPTSTRAWTADGRRAGRGVAAGILALAGRGVWRGGTADEGLRRAGRGAGWVQRQRRASLRGRGAIGSRASCCCAQALRERAAGGALFPAGPRHCPPPAGEVLGTAGGDEPEPPVAAAGQAETKLVRCWRRSTAGSPKGSTPPTSRRPRRC